MQPAKNSRGQSIELGKFCRRCGAWCGLLGAEPSPALYVRHMVEVFREVRRVLKPDGTLWLNLGDCYAGSWGNYGGQNRGAGTQRPIVKGSAVPVDPVAYPSGIPPNARVRGLKPKDLVGIPWRVALALQADGWYLRSDIIWAKPNPMPESVTDRPTKSHEYLFLLSKSERYYFDQAAVREPVTGNSHARGDGVNPKARNWKTPDGWDTTKGNGGHGSSHKEGREKGATGYQPKRPKQNESFAAAVAGLVESRNIRTVWDIATEQYRGAHFATFPQKLVEPCILVGSRPGDLVLDPFGGTGTVGRVAERLSRRWVCLDLKYQDLAAKRTTGIQKDLLLQPSEVIEVCCEPSDAKVSG